MKLFRAFFVGFFLCIALFACQKPDTWDFDYPKDELCKGTWFGEAIYSDNRWVDLTSPENRKYQFDITFCPDGTFFGSGFYGNGSGTYEAHGNIIRTYCDGELYYTYIIHSLTGNTAELTMQGDLSASRIRVRRI